MPPAIDVIYADLTAKSGSAGVDMSGAVALDENKNVSVSGCGAKRKGLPDASFLIPGARARELLQLPTNPNGKRNVDVVRP